MSPWQFGGFTLIYSILLFANCVQSGLITQPHNIFCAYWCGAEKALSGAYLQEFPLDMLRFTTVILRNAARTASIADPSAGPAGRWQPRS